MNNIVRAFIVCLVVSVVMLALLLYTSQQNLLKERKNASRLSKTVKSLLSKNQIIQASTEYTLERFKRLQTELSQADEKIATNQFELKRKTVRLLVVTAYTPTERECNKDPNWTAAMLKPRPGLIAVSRDLFNDGWVFGRKVRVEGIGIFTIGDLMNSRWKNRVDILMFDKNQAFRFGKQKISVALLDL